jgi:hypothetical protein
MILGDQNTSWQGEMQHKATVLIPDYQGGVELSHYFSHDSILKRDKNGQTPGELKNSDLRRKRIQP